MKTIYKLTADEMQALRTIAYVECDNVDCLDCPYNLNEHECISSACTNLLKRVGSDGVYDADKEEYENDN